MRACHGRVTYTLHNSLCLTGFGNCALAIWMDQLSHSGGTDKQRETAVNAEDIRLGVDLADIAQHARTEKDAVEARLVRVAGDQISRSTGVERPCFPTDSARGNFLEIVGVDQCVEWWLFVVSQLGCLGRRWLQPVIIDGGIIDNAQVFVRGEVGLQDAWRVDLRVRLGGIAASVLQDDCRGPLVCPRLRLTLRIGMDVSLADPPGCSSRKSVMSHTWLSTTTQQSSWELCAEISRVDRTFLSGMSMTVFE